MAGAVFEGPTCYVQKSLMPKGVDHQNTLVLVFFFSLVQKSLMPKGVDHLLVGHLIGVNIPSAKIFDAERR